MFAVITNPVIKTACKDQVRLSVNDTPLPVYICVIINSSSSGKEGNLCHVPGPGQTGCPGLTNCFQRLLSLTLSIPLFIVTSNQIYNKGTESESR